jgi:uncharacterized repeat protein (TIGR01451 family)
LASCTQYGKTTGEIRYQTTGGAGESGTATLSQSLTIPAGRDAPVLCLLHRQRMTQPNGATGLRVTLSDGVTTTLLLSATESGGRVPAYADVQPWAGQQVTVTVGLLQAAGEPYARLYLDEVTLGSAYPDLWVSKSGPPLALPGKQVTFEIRYGNRAGVEAAGVTLTDVLPSGLSFVSADPPPDDLSPSPRWTIDSLPAHSGPFTVILTAAVAPDAPMMRTLTNMVAVETEGPQIEVLNNQAQAGVWVGYRICLPLVVRSW